MDHLASDSMNLLLNIIPSYSTYFQNINFLSQSLFVVVVVVFLCLLDIIVRCTTRYCYLNLLLSTCPNAPPSITLPVDTDPL